MKRIDSRDLWGLETLYSLFCSFFFFNDSQAKRILGESESCEQHGRYTLQHWSWSCLLHQPVTGRETREISSLRREQPSHVTWICWLFLHFSAKLWQIYSNVVVTEYTVYHRMHKIHVYKFTLVLCDILLLLGLHFDRENRYWNLYLCLMWGFKDLFLNEV